MTDTPKPSIAEILLPIPVDTAFSYAVPAELAPITRPGVQAVVPLGQRYEVGIVLAVREPDASENRELKSIQDIVEESPFLSDELLRLLNWISDYYVCNKGEALRLVHPAQNMQKAAFQLRRANGLIDNLKPAQQELLEVLADDEWISIEQIEKRIGAKQIYEQSRRLKNLGLVETRFLPPQPKPIYKTHDAFTLRATENWSDLAVKKYIKKPNKRSGRALELVEYLKGQDDAVFRFDLYKAGFSAALILRLEKEGVLERHKIEYHRQQDVSYTEESTHGIPAVSDLQQEFIDLASPSIGQNSEAKTYLLHGITGSGKTRIYIELIRKALESNLHAIVLIPEIVLTPQTMARFYAAFGDRVAMLHSRLSPGERLEVIDKIRRGLFDLVIGPRSAVFAPFPRLGLIIVDEEHEPSYKQTDQQPRYHAREVALYRASLNQIPVVLGSATPSIESLYNAHNGKYEYFHLSKRVQERSLPRTRIVDLREEWKRTGKPPIFSEVVLLQMEARRLCREQTMLLQNRRGFSPYLQCQDCGFVLDCPNCDITLTYHTVGKKMCCHYCDYSEPAPSVCSECGGTDILYQGIGTQKIEEEAKRLAPHLRLLRMDQDTTRRKDDYVDILTRFRNHEADVLIGTKMIAKGLDFGTVTLIGVINADQGLHFPDFRATEKTFQLLVQAAGRAGRGVHSGEVYVQTYDPGHFIFKFLLSHDYSAFYEREVETRRHLGYPPFSRLALVRLSGPDENSVVHFANELGRFLNRSNPERTFSVLGPAPSPIPRIDNQFRYQILIKQPRDKDPSMKYLRHLLKEGIYKSTEVKKWPVRVQIDVDPVDIL